jgi:hypothetical protein
MVGIFGARTALGRLRPLMALPLGSPLRSGSAVKHKREHGLVIPPIRGDPRTRIPARHRHQGIAHALGRGQFPEATNRSRQDVDGGRVLLFERFRDAIADDDAQIARFNGHNLRFVSRVGEQTCGRAAEWRGPGPAPQAGRWAAMREMNSWKR